MSKILPSLSPYQMYGAAFPWDFSSDVHEFYDALKFIVHSMPGWAVYSGNSASVEIRCPHGRVHVLHVSATYLAPSESACHLFKMAVCGCLETCLPKMMSPSYKVGPASQDIGASVFALTKSLAAKGYVSEVDTPHPGSVAASLIKIFPALARARALCPAPNCLTGGAFYITQLIPHINDDHRWSREQIADWLETLPYDFSAKENVDAKD